MRLLLIALALVTWPLPAIADPASAKAWLCQRKPHLVMCRVQEGPPRPPPPMEEEEPIEFLPEPMPAAPVPPPLVSVPNKSTGQPTSVTKPAPRSAPAKARPKARPTDRPRATAAPAAQITPAQCARLRGAISQYGLAKVRAGAPMFGYSSASVDWAKAACGI